MVGVQSRHLVDPIQDESVRLRSPDLADVFVGREAVLRLEPPVEVVYCHEVALACPKLIVVVAREALHRGVLDRPVYPLDLTIGRRKTWLDQPVFDPMYVTDQVKVHLPGPSSVPSAGLIGELGVVGQDRVDPVGHDVEQVPS